MTLRPRFGRPAGLVLALSDFCALTASLGLSCALRALSGGHLPPADYLALLPVFTAFVLLYAVLGLYPGILRPAYEELKRLSLGTSLGFLFLSFLLFLGQQGVTYSRFVMLCSWLLSLAAVPLFRHLCRMRFAGRAWWGYPVLLFSHPKNDRFIIRAFLEDRRCGLYIAESISLDAGRGSSGLSGASGPDDATLRELALRHPGALACIIADALPPEDIQPLVLRFSRHFKRIVVRLEAQWLRQSSLHVADFPFGPALTMRQNLLDPARMRLKRCLDLALCLPAGFACLALFPFIALYIRLDTKGPVFFFQRRIGLHGRPFNVIKFRTMVANAPDILSATLEHNPKLRDEWSNGQKLAHDPRMTGAGLFLRRTSLDELPQIINVIRGEMSLVGPRPIVEDEIERYGEAFDLYSRVRPGITGLWQVSGRNALQYERRIELDQYYVYNWSVWLDIYIMLRTLPTVISGKGAY